jgi:beta-1,4-mannosyl-glycoprotein beta-1,4-N-acetylglucosaminyltransferase
MIYDAFPFFNELDVLEIRLHVLAEVVDRFVLVEARKTFQRGDKPLHYAANKERFNAFADRIEHVVVDDFPAEASDARACEIWQRNAIRLGLRGAALGDTVLISDVDEIPRPECVVTAARRGGVTVFRQLMFCYFLNYIHLRDDGEPGAFWGGTVAYRNHPRAETPQRYSELRPLGGAKARSLRARLRAKGRKVRRINELEGRARLLDNAGWHFSYQGGIDSIVAKLEAYSHVEYNSPRFKARDAIAQAIAEKRDLFGRAGRYTLVPVDRQFPLWLQEHATTRYSHLLAPEN